MTDAQRVVAILLAAGRSQRMGRPKQTLPWAEGKSLVDWVAERILATGLPLVGVVPPELADAAPSGVVAWAVNPHPGQGLASSIRVGVAAALDKGTWEGMAFFLGDQPFVTADDVQRVLRAFAERRPGIHAVRPRYDGRPGHPVVVDAAVWERAGALEGDIGFGRWIRPEELEEVAIAVGSRPDPAIDLDTPADYARWHPTTE
ncbi:MAG: nucleotidyltransferase family protein [Firmicutes bacterium]|nr:nucleotidyltransferase family protein [Alicyclobacillaceae bacterium]MCL6497576.1 nucleotidyltransferase family protein [Bacillota bacterium]